MWRDLKLPPITYPLKLLAIYAIVGGIGGVLFLIGAVIVSYPMFAAGAATGAVVCGIVSYMQSRQRFHFRRDAVNRFFSHQH
jgi:hypothetical protein